MKKVSETAQVPGVIRICVVKGDPPPASSQSRFIKLQTNTQTSNAMKRRTVFLAIAASLLTSMVSTVSAQSIRLINQINEIIPSQAVAGQTITIKISNTNILLTDVLKDIQANSKLQRFVGRFPTRPSEPLKILFTGATANSFVEGQNMTRLSADTYTVRVPNGARSGPMKLQRGLASSTSTVRFTLATTGFSFVNLSQFNVVSIKVDNVERLSPGQVIAAVPQTAPNVNILDVGTATGNRTVQVTMGLDAARPIMVLFFGARPAQTLISAQEGFRNPILLNVMLGGEYLASSPNTVSATGTSRTVSWQALQVQANGNLVVHGFDFTFNSANGSTTFKHWIGDRPNVDAQGTVTEPTPVQWGVNLPGANLPLHRTNGSLFTNILVDLAAARFTAADGLTYEMQ